MTTDSRARVNVRRVIVDTSLTDVAIGYSLDFGAVLIAVRCSLSCAFTQLTRRLAVCEWKGKACDE
jgi:hypothetical protein